MTVAEIRQMTKEIDSLVIGADSVAEMYRKLNTLRDNGDADWQLLRAPWWVKGQLIAVVLRPSKDVPEVAR